jgi:RNA polymerase sigma factor (sigma-70 family)
VARSIADPGAFRLVVERHGDRMFGYLADRVGAEPAEDLCCDLWEQAFNARRSFDPARGSVVGWLYGFARPLVLKYRRRVARTDRAHQRAAVVLIEVTDAPDDAVIAATDSASAAPAVLRALARLSDDDRDLFELAVWEGLSYREIAQVMGIATNTVGSRLTRARHRLAAEAGLRWTS